MNAKQRLHFSYDSTTRNEIKEELQWAVPTKVIAPFGISKEFIPLLAGAQVITQPGHTPQNPPPNTKLYTNNNIHAKAWIGENKAIIGSGNFHFNNYAEIYVITTDKEDIRKLNIYFNMIAKRGTEIRTIKHITEMM